MSSRTKKTFAWLWIAALLTATIGISIQQIYCYCLGKTTISFFSTAESCAAETDINPADCCTQPEKKAPSCCTKAAGTFEKKHNCTQKTTRVFQLKTEFVVENPFEKSFEGPLWLEDFPLFRHYFRPVVCEARYFNKALPPPPLSGRDVCLRHHIFRC